MKKRFIALGVVIVAVTASGCSQSDNPPSPPSVATVSSAAASHSSPHPLAPHLTAEQRHLAKEKRKQAEEQQKRELARKAHEEQIAEEQQAQHDAEQKYHQDFEDWTGAMGEAWTSLGALLQNPNFGDDDWTGEVGHECLVLEEGIEAGRKLHAPARYRKVGRLLNQHLDDVQGVPATVAASIGSSDAEMMASCQPKIAKGRVDIKKAIEAMDEASQ